MHRMAFKVLKRVTLCDSSGELKADFFTQVSRGGLEILWNRLPRPASPCFTDSDKVSIGMTKMLLAGELGIWSETLSRILARLRDAGLITVKGRTIIVSNPSSLQAAFEKHLGSSTGA